METTNNANIYSKLLKVQQELKAPKGQYNAFGKYNYRNCEDILEAVKPILAKVSALITLYDEVELIGERHYVKATANFIDCESGEIISNFAYAREEDVKKGMDGSQITGASSSYARKYALNGLLCIDDTKDSDTTNSGKTEKKCTKEQVARMEELGVILAGIQKKFGVESLSELSYEQAEFVIKAKEKASKEQ